MSRKLLQKVSVRITVKANGKAIVGSGVLTRNKNGEWYVITAEHCINGKKEDRLTGVTFNNIVIEHKHHNEDKFKTIKAKKISYCSEKNDISVILIENIDYYSDDIIYCNFMGDMNGSLLYFRGFPKFLNNEAKTYECEIEEPDILKFYIKTPEIKDITLGKKIEVTSSGLSGSGVFCHKDGKIFLLGIVTDLRDSKGTFGHICCRKLNDVYDELNYNTENISGGIEELSKWKKIDSKFIAQKIQELKDSKSDEFDNLERKCRIMYDEDDVEEMINIFLSDYFNAKVNITNIASFNSFINEAFEETRIQLSKRIKKSFNKRIVANKSDAQDIYNEVVNIFISILGNEKTGEINKNNLTNMSDYAVVDLLLNCDLDFKKL